ncbi:MAG: helix-turn-helix domain-containing protein [Planctomycetaceae bacterium]|nr:helix-turn-helix domain-containing protein [Planctomycetaceae bacterium]MCA9030827.1 helix-turn-helix domain-containing protein [Planctomycetaceae bacterium]MCA9045726.1 helix-turn-helix domain-containing protein [Planctomycetaceae bacterium]MCB9950988.1 helix-turn-helix domain-containing protein [Planctomycetaceae bacterium]
MSEQTTSPVAEPKAGVLLSVNRVAEMLGCSPRTVYRLSDAGKMPAPRKVATLVRWHRPEIEQWIADGCPVVRR